MTHLILASTSFGQVILTIALVTVSLLLIGLILLQKNRGSGLSGAFGGVGGHTAFGTKTGDFLTWVTVGLAAFFLLLSVVANFVFDRQTISAENTAPAPISTPVQPLPIAQPKIKTIPISPSGAKPTVTMTPQPAAAPQTSAQPPVATPPAPVPTTQPSH
jgi:preprotein translocase subunit SecG